MPSTPTVVPPSPWRRNASSTAVMQVSRSSRSATSLRVSSSVTLLDRVHHIEDREVHGHDHAAHDHAQDDDHDRLHQGQQRADGGLDEMLTKVADFYDDEVDAAVSDLGEHLVESAGLLADGDHRDHHRWEDFR